jgi:hypothetical protein
LEKWVLRTMYHLRTAATVHVPVFANMSLCLVSFSTHSGSMFACPSAIEDKTKNVLDVAVSDSPVCFAPIVELIVPILPRSGDGYAACLYLVGLKWHPHGFLHDSDHSSCPLARRRLCFQASALFSHISSAVIDRGASITMFLMT